MLIFELESGVPCPGCNTLHILRGSVVNAKLGPGKVEVRVQILAPLGFGFMWYFAIFMSLSNKQRY